MKILQPFSNRKSSTQAIEFSSHDPKSNYLTTLTLLEVFDAPEKHVLKSSACTQRNCIRVFVCVFGFCNYTGGELGGTIENYSNHAKVAKWL